MMAGQKIESQGVMFDENLQFNYLIKNFCENPLDLYFLSLK